MRLSCWYLKPGVLNLLQAGPPQSWFIAVWGPPPQSALPCKDPQFLAQFLINIASNHPLFVHDCGILSAVIFENPASHKYVDAKGRRIVKVSSQSWGYSCINAAQNDERGQEVKSSFRQLSLLSSNKLFLHINWQLVSCAHKWVLNPRKRAIILFKVRRKLFSHCWQVLRRWLK